MINVKFHRFAIVCSLATGLWYIIVKLIDKVGLETHNIEVFLLPILWVLGLYLASRPYKSKSKKFNQ